VFDLVLEMGQLGDNLLALLHLGAIVARAYGAVGIVNRLGLEETTLVTTLEKEMEAWARTCDDDGPAFAGGRPGKRRRVGCRVDGWRDRD
jgi:hypothetical protein